MNTEQVQERLEAIKERCEKATGGPWSLDKFNCVIAGFHWIAIMDSTESPAVESCNADFIIHSRSDIPYLVSVIESLMGEVSDG